ncbi:MAG: hypothetical protein ACPGVG_16020, partial [Mycobacterium sp.]
FVERTKGGGETTTHALDATRIIAVDGEGNEYVLSIVAIDRRGLGVDPRLGRLHVTGRGVIHVAPLAANRVAVFRERGGAQ